jgi:glucosamine--fructose-6-phosphate aminotransferase (isomerizing)
MVRVAERLSGRRGIETIAITLRDNTPFTEIVDRKILLPEVFDRSVVMTRSYSTMLLLCEILAHLRAGRKEALRSLDKLAECGERILADAAGLAGQLGALPFRHYLFLAQGPLLGVAEEASLKMKEMSLSISECFPSLEERHGPKSVVDEGTLVTVFTSQQSAAVEEPLIQELAGLGATSLQIVEAGVTGSRGNRHTFALNSGLSLWQRIPLYVLPAQLLALAVARRKGIDSDSPRALTASVDIVASEAGI